MVRMANIESRSCFTETSYEFGWELGTTLLERLDAESVHTGCKGGLQKIIRAVHDVPQIVERRNFDTSEPIDLSDTRSANQAIGTELHPVEGL